jgi:Raf kinase inhibitor-like YbhB/YbcL family protein
MKMKLTSPAFMPGQTIPKQYTGEGTDVSPPLSWDAIPEDTHCFALIADDPDSPVGTWVHWVLYGLSPKLTALPENVPASERVSLGACQGLNDFGQIGYGGPMPPPGKTHRYFFTLYALDHSIKLPPKATKEELLHAMEGHVLAQAELVGTYQR